VVSKPIPVAEKVCSADVFGATDAGDKVMLKTPSFQILPTGICTVSGNELEFGPGLEPSTLVTAGNPMCAPQPETR
jgi:hypothetical protein